MTITTNKWFTDYFQDKVWSKRNAKPYQGYKFTLCIRYEITIYLVTVPIHQSGSEEKGDTLIDNVISKYYIPD